MSDDLISRHFKGCPHYRNEEQNIFCLADEDSYDVCTCLRNFVSTVEHEKVVAELKRYKERERDICKAVGGVSDGGQYRNDIIEHLTLLVTQHDEALELLRTINSVGLKDSVEAKVEAFVDRAKSFGKEP